MGGSPSLDNLSVNTQRNQDLKNVSKLPSEFHHGYKVTSHGYSTNNISKKPPTRRYVEYVDPEDGKKRWLGRNEYLVLKKIYEYTSKRKPILKSTIYYELASRDKLIRKQHISRALKSLKNKGLIAEINNEIQLTVKAMKILTSLKDPDGSWRVIPHPPSPSKAFYIHKIVTKLEFTDDLLPIKLFVALRKLASNKNISYYPKEGNPYNHIFIVSIKRKKYTIQVTQNGDKLTFTVFMPAFKVEDLNEAPKIYEELKKDLLTFFSLLLGKDVSNQIVFEEKIKTILRDNEIETDLEEWEQEAFDIIKEEYKEKTGYELRAFSEVLPYPPVGIDGKTILDRPNEIRFESYQGENKKEMTCYEVSKRQSFDSVVELYKILYKLNYGKEPEEDQITLKKKTLALVGLIASRTKDLTLETIKDLKEFIVLSTLNQYLLSENIKAHVGLVKQIKEGMSEFSGALKDFTKILRMAGEVIFWRILAIIQTIIIILLLVLGI